MKTIRHWSPVVLAAALGGCLGLGDLGGPEGTWTIDGERMKEILAAAAEEEIQEQLAALSFDDRSRHEERLRQELAAQAALALAFLETFSMELTLEPGGNWTSVSRVFGFSVTEAGTWENQGGSLTLTTLEKDHQPLAEPTVESFRFEGGEIHYQEDGAPTDFVLTRKL